MSENILPTLEQFAALASARHSQRFFSTKPLEKSQILSLLDIADRAPSVDNLKPWRFHVVFTKDLRQRLMEASCYGNFVEGASVFVVVSCDTGAKSQGNTILWNPRELEYSCVVAMSSILYSATAAGIASCWVSLHHAAAHEILRLEKNQIVIGGIMLGHPRKVEDDRSSILAQTQPTKQHYTIYE